MATSIKEKPFYGHRSTEVWFSKELSIASSRQARCQTLADWLLRASLAEPGTRFYRTRRRAGSIGGGTVGKQTERCEKQSGYGFATSAKV